MKTLRRYEQLLDRRPIIQKALDRWEQQCEEINEELRASYEAMDILSEINRAVHQSIIERVETVITLALRHVYDRPLEARIIFDTTKSSAKVTPVIYENGEEYDIRSELGGGLVDIASLAMRIAIWSIRNPQLRNLFIFDEPFKWTGSYITKAGEMLQQLATELNLQVILVTHDEAALLPICDRVYRVTHDGEVATVKPVKRKITRRRER